MSSPTIGVLGGGQLGLMLLEAAEQLNVKVVVLDAEGSPAMKIAKHKVYGSFNKPDDVRRLARECDILTVEIEHVNTYILEELAENGIDGRKIEVQPHWRTLRIIQDKYLQKQKLQEYNIPTAHSIPVDSADTRELEFIGAVFGYPYMLKSRKLAYDGRGNFPVKSSADIPAALKALGSRSLYAEKWASFRAELAVMVIKTEDEETSIPDSCTIAYPVVETVHEDSICKLVYAPARKVPAEILLRASTLARKTIAAFEGRGIFGVEMFLLDDGMIYLQLYKT
jgi:phosphoribosylaminoimidazole carboxylase